MTVTPSAILVAAADRIRDLAAGTTPGPWEPGVNVALLPPLHDFTKRPVQPDVIVAEEKANARWIAALSPAVSGPLEAILRAAAHDVTVSGMVLNSVEFKAALGDRFAPALTLARLLCPELAQVRVQCSGAVHNLSLSAPERCALEEGHEGTCEP
jgi:hypothetical protein